MRTIKSVSGWMSLVGGILFFVLPAGAQTLSVTIEDFSIQFTGSDPDRLAVHTVDGSGLNTGTNPPTHGVNPNGFMWLNTGDGAFGGGPDPDRPGQLGHITFDLGGTFFVDNFRVWNYNEVNTNTGQSFTNRGIQTLTISTATSAGGPFTLLTDPSDNDTTFTFAQAPGNTSYTGQLFSFPILFEAAFVRFDIKTNYGDANGFVGLSEVQFAVPEPGTWLLISAGAAVLWAGQRRRRKLS